MGLDNRFCDGQPETRAAAGPAARSIGAPESFEDVREIVGGNALARVGDYECHRTPVLLHRDANFATVPVVVDGVGKKVGYDEGDTIGVANAVRGGQIGV